VRNGAAPSRSPGRLRRADTVSRIFDWIEQQAVRIQRIRPIGDGGYILRLRVTRHRGPRIVLRDGTVVEPGDVVGELHLDNQRAAALHAEGHGGFRYRHEIFRALPALAREIRERPEYHAIKAFYGASLFWASSRLAAETGFEIRPLPAFTRWWQGGIERYLLAHYHPEGRRRLDRGGRTELRQVWTSRRALLGFAERRAEGRRR
jgi:hypothetical protein